MNKNDEHLSRLVALQEEAQTRAVRRARVVSELRGVVALSLVIGLALLLLITYAAQR